MPNLIDAGGSDLAAGDLELARKYFELRFPGKKVDPSELEELIGVMKANPGYRELIIRKVRGQGVAEGTDQGREIRNKKGTLLGTWDGRTFTMDPSLEQRMTEENGPEWIESFKNIKTQELQQQSAPSQDRIKYYANELEKYDIQSGQPRQSRNYYYDLAVQLLSDQQGVAEGSSQAVSDITVKKILDGGYDGLTQWHVFRGDEMIGYVNLNQEGFADGLYLAYGHGPGRAEREEFNGLKSAVKFIAGLREGVAEGDYQADSDGSDVDVIDRGEYDYEGDQARDQLRTIVRAARRLNGIIDDDDNLPEWVQMKITKATDYIDTAADYMQSNADQSMEEAKYQGREVPLGKPMAGDVKKSKVYVRGPKGNVVKVNFGQKGMKIKKNIPGRRKNFRARHNCDNPGPRWKARYWSCRAW